MRVALVALDADDTEPGVVCDCPILLNGSIDHLVLAGSDLHTGTHTRLAKDDSTVGGELAEPFEERLRVGTIEVHQQPSEQDAIELALQGR